MSHNVKITGERNDVRAKVTKYGQLVTAPLDYSSLIQEKLSLINVAYNLLEPTQGQQIVITGIILTANRLVGVNDATVDLYLADSETEQAFSPDDAVLSLELEKNGKLPLTGLNIITQEGKWINAKTNDNDIFITLLYYRVPVNEL